MIVSGLNKIANCRRSMISLFGIGCLTFIAVYCKTDIAGIALAIAGISGSLSAANSYEATKTGKVTDGRTIAVDNPDN